MLRTRPGSRPAGPLAIAGPPFLLGVPVPLSPCFPSSLSSRAVSSPGRPPVLPTLPGRPVSSPLWSFPSPLVLIPAPLLCAVSHLTHRLRVRGQRARLWALRRVRVPVSRCSVAVGRRVQCYFPGFSLGIGFCDLAFTEPAWVQWGCRASREPGQAVGAADAAGIPGSCPVSLPVHPMPPSGRPVFSDSGETAHFRRGPRLLRFGEMWIFRGQLRCSVEMLTVVGGPGGVAGTLRGDLHQAERRGAVRCGEVLSGSREAGGLARVKRRCVPGGRAWP